jgi:glycosyltransferase involved in cell wall biosynthesis
MRVAIVTRYLKKQDGQGRVNFELARELLSRGHSVLLVASEVEPSLLEIRGAEWARIPVPPVPTYLLREQIFAVLSSAVLAREHRRLQAIVVNGFATWWRSDVNIVNFVHHAWLKSPLHPARGRPGLAALYRWLYTAVNAKAERAAFAQARSVVAISEIVRRQVVDCGVDADRITVIPGGVDLLAFSPGTGRRSDFGLPEDPFMGLFAGDLRTARKNLDSVLKAMTRVPDMHLAVAGDTAKSPYPAMARSLGIAGRVHFVGMSTELGALMRAVDAFVFPTRFEPFGLVLLEASACGLPIVTSRAAGACESLDGDGMIVLEDPDDVAGLAAALETLASDTALRRRMGRSARVAAERLSWKSAVARQARLIEAVARV